MSLIIRLRKDLAAQGLDAGPQTIAWHLRHHHQIQAHRRRSAGIWPGPGW